MWQPAVRVPFFPWELSMYGMVPPAFGFCARLAAVGFAAHFCWCFFDATRVPRSGEVSACIVGGSCRGKCGRGRRKATCGRYTVGAFRWVYTSASRTVDGGCLDAERNLRPRASTLFFSSLLPWHGVICECATRNSICRPRGSLGSSVRSKIKELIGSF